MGTIALLNGAFDTEDLNPPTQARYPALSHFWKCDENGAGQNNLVDSIAAANITSPAPDIITFTGDGIKIATPTSMASWVTTTAFAFQGKSMVFAALGTRAAGNAIGFGAVSSDGIYITNNNNYYDDGTAAPAKDTGNPSTGTDEFAILTLDTSKSDTSGIELADVSATDYTPITSLKSGDASAITMAGITDTFRCANWTNLYSMMIFEFDVLPSNQELQNAMLWMRERHMASTVATPSKVIYPGWLNRS